MVICSYCVLSLLIWFEKLIPCLGFCLHLNWCTVLHLNAVESCLPCCRCCLSVQPVKSAMYYTSCSKPINRWWYRVKATICSFLFRTHCVPKAISLIWDAFITAWRVFSIFSMLYNMHYHKYVYNTFSMEQKALWSKSGVQGSCGTEIYPLKWLKWE